MSRTMSLSQNQSFVPSLIARWSLSATQQKVYSLVTILMGVSLLAACAQLKIVLPFTPVPITGQTFGVLLLAMVFGSRLGTAAVGGYLLLGAVGAPVFAQSSGPHTLGYLFGMLVAARLVGTLADRGWMKSLGLALGAGLLGTLVVFAFGLPVLGYFVGFEKVLALGFYPFIPGGLVKITLAALCARGLSALQ